MDLREIDSQDEATIEAILSQEGWTDDQIAGQVHAIRALGPSDSGLALVADDGGGFAGFVSVEVYEWNRLAQIHGLVVARQQRRKGIATRLVAAAEDFARSRAARGVYVDTPVDNQAARSFYEANGFFEAYRMPRYYSDQLDGVTFAKFFD